MPAVRLGSSSEHLSLVPEPVTGPPDLLVASLELSGLSATAPVVNNYATGFRDLAEFFQRLADDWRGWVDLRSWESLEGDLRIEARHEYGHVHLIVTIRRDRTDWGNEGWRATGDLTIDPGEQLSQIARDLAALAHG